MPSVGMRRTTRVFGARVLRSGRRLWSGPGEEGKHMRAASRSAANGEEWIELLDTSGDGGGGVSSGDEDGEIRCKESSNNNNNGWRPGGVIEMEIEEKIVEPKLVGNVGEGLLSDNCNGRSVDRMWGCVYRRKRKRIDSKSFDFESGCEKKRRGLEDDRMYGKQFVRKKWKVGESCVSLPLVESCGWKGPVLAAAVVESSSLSSCDSTRWFACLLNLVLRYMRRANLRLLQLSAFVISEPLAHVFSFHGIRFSRDSPSIKSSGICKIFGARGFVPLFSVDFSAVPFCFMYLHSSLLLRSACFPYVSEIYFSSMMDDRMPEVVEYLPCISTERDPPVIETVTSGNDNSEKRNVMQFADGAPRLTVRAAQFRNCVNSRSIRKRRSSLRSKRRKNPSVYRGRKPNGALVSNLFGPRHDGILLAPVASDRQLRSSVRRNSIPNKKELKSSLVAPTQDIGSTSCSANILVIETDKCYRIKDAIVKLEMSASKQWCLAVMKNGTTRYSIIAQKVMRPCSSNRVTHDIIWTEDINNWKLEFPDKRDWLIFKELYKECSDRNVQAPSANYIPVPGVYEVSGYADSNDVPFKRPCSYMSLKDDELSRALAKQTANYDMDNEDEEWLRKFNNESSAGNEHWEHVSEEIFELIIDAFEKAFFYNPDDYPDEKAALNLCSNLERREVVEAVYSHWMEKRRQKRSALIRIFQCYQPRRAHLLPKSVLRKKRSFKRQANQSGRGKQRPFLQAMAAEQDAVEEQNALHRVQEAEAAASRSEGLAVVKRQRAQLLMENADLVAYKAAVALRIAEAARVAESAEAAASFFLQ